MLFSEKLSFLMNLAGTNNAQLARVLQVDPSRVSRLRTGARSAPPNFSILEKMSGYFACACLSEYQRTALSEMLAQPRIRLVSDAESLQPVLYEWMTSPPKSALTREKRYLGGAQCFPISTAPSTKDTDLMILLANEDRRKYVRMYAEQLLVREAAQTKNLLVFSDESADWLLDDPSFGDDIGRILLGFLKNGARVQRILPANRTLSELLDSVERWLPLYLTGNVIPHSLTRIRDGIYHRSLYVIHGKIAMHSTSVGEQKENGAAILTKNPRLVEYYENEFAHLLSMCRPAMARFTADQLAHFSQRLRAPAYAWEGSIHRSGGLSVISMPIGLLHIFKQRAKNPIAAKLCAHDRHNPLLNERELFSTRVIDIISLATPQELSAGKVPFSLDHSVYYSVQEYALHLRRIVFLLKTQPNYSVFLLNENWPECNLYIRQYTYAFIFQTSAPYALYDFSCSTAISALWEYLHAKLPAHMHDDVNRRKDALARIEGLLRTLEDF